jgi:large subunit ribosomal protein L2
MGKDLIQQRRGRGSVSYRRHSFSSPGSAKVANRGNATIIELIHSYLHTAPLARVRYEDGEDGLIIVPEGVRTGQVVQIGADAPLELGNTLPLQALPEGSLIYNIEAQPGDGGKFVRASGGVARIVGKTADVIMVQLPSKKRREFNPLCRASLGVVAGGGRPEKPFLKAGKRFHRVKARDKYWPSVSGAAMNAVDHPLGGKRSSRKGRPTIAPKNAPPGRKVGMIRPRHTGRNK